MAASIRGVLLSQCVTLRNGLRQLLFGFAQLALQLGDFLFSLAFRDSLVEIRLPLLYFILLFQDIEFCLGAQRAVRTPLADLAESFFQSTELLLIPVFSGVFHLCLNGLLLTFAPSGKVVGSEAHTAKSDQSNTKCRG